MLFSLVCLYLPEFEYLMLALKSVVIVYCLGLDLGTFTFFREWSFITGRGGQKIKVVVHGFPLGNSSMCYNTEY